MKEYKFISFTANPPPRASLWKMLTELNITKKSDIEEIDGAFYVRMLTNDPRLEKLVAELDKLPLDPPWHYRVEVEYERSDLESCEFVSLHIDRAAKGDTGPMYDTEYDLSTACPECGTGARQVSPLRISASALPKKARAMRTHHGEILIGHDLATDLMVALGSERGLRRAEERRIRTDLPWWQVLPETYMPPAELATGHRVVNEQCPRCKRDGFGFGEEQRPLEFTYRMSENDRRALPDFVYTWEHFGTSRIKWKPGYTIGLAHAAILVSNRVMRALWAAKLREGKFTPVRFIG